MPAEESKPPLRLLFDSLIHIEGTEQRNEFLDFTCRDSPVLRARLERLLALHHKVDDYFDIGVSPPATTALPQGNSQEGEGTRIGRYLLLGRLGEGGCGVVYLAEQQEPVKRRVALKIIRLGMDTEKVIARFELESQALAMMDHPNIARVLDGGTTNTGRPFFVMQLVDGEKITTYCDANRLTIPARLKLFIRICQAVQHAHQKGVIHRDIKPSNILVWEHDGEAVPKIIDFGISKATSAGLDLQATFTVDGQFVGTPAYMSPEQASGSGLDVDTRTDVYSLGSLLYELLSGQPAFDPSELRDAGIEEIRRVIREQDPPGPSTLVGKLAIDRLREVAECRSCDSQKIVSQLKGDLGRIVMKAMAKDRQHRYSGADALAADIVCYLNNEPVSARSPGGFYRLGKLVRRNKVVFAAGSLIFLSLVLGLGAATAMYIRANRSREVAELAREAAEVARTNEAVLRQKAVSVQVATNAAVLAKHGQFEIADEAMMGAESGQIEPSLENAETFRALGIWHAREGRWQKAADRFVTLARMLSSTDQSDSSDISLSLQPAAATTIAAGDLEAYEELRRMAIRRFAKTTNPVVAEQILKICLLKPAEPELLVDVEGWEDIILNFHKSNHSSDPFEVNMAAWRAFALALIEYRKGNLDRAAEWLDECARSPQKNLARDAASEAMWAMIWQGRGNLAEAERKIAAGRAILEERFSRLPEIFDEWEPVWQDWVNARILIQEAEAQKGG